MCNVQHIIEGKARISNHFFEDMKMDRMNQIPEKKNTSFETDQTAEANKSEKKSKKPATPKDRSAPRMKSLSTSNDPHVTDFNGGKKKSSTASDERVQQKGDQELSGLLVRDEKFVKRKLREIPISHFSKPNKFSDVVSQLYELAASANEAGIEAIVEFALFHKDRQDVCGALVYRAVEDGNTRLFQSLKSYMPGLLFADGIKMMLPALGRSSATGAEIHHAISVIKTLLKDGVDCAKDEQEKLAEWAKQHGDQELAGLLVRDEKFVGRKLKEIPASHFSKSNKSVDVASQLYELAASANEAGIETIVEFALFHKDRQDVCGALVYRAIEDGNARLFQSLKSYMPGVLFADGIKMVLPTLRRSTATDAEVRHALTVIKTLLKDGVDCTTGEMRALAEWAKQHGDQELEGFLV